MSTHVMDGGGYYNRHSAQQEESAAVAIAMLRRASAAAASSAKGVGPVVVADYGSSEGRNSIHPVAVAIDELRAGGARGPVAVVHTDLPANDFSSLFETVEADPDSYRRDGVFTYAAGRSFYERLFPDASVTLGWSATAAIWLRSTPCPLPDHLFSYSATGEAHATWRRAAASDWRTFLDHRAHELRPGGELVVSLLVAGPGYREWMDVVEAGAREAAERGVVTRPEYEAMVVPTYLSEPDDLCDAVRDTGGLRLAEWRTAVAPDPAFTAYEQHGDVQRYAAEAVDLMRAWAEPSLMSALDAGRDAAGRAATADAFFACIAGRLAATPTANAWTVGLLRAARG